MRVSMGHVLNVPFAKIDNLESGLDELGAMGFTSLAFTPDNGSVTVDKSLEQGVQKPMLLFGAEGPGLSASVKAKADQCVRIEMTKDVDSLNIAVSAAVGIHRYINPA